MFDVLKYKPVIDKVLRRFKVRKMDKDDMSQECYVVLLERQHKLEAAADDNGLAELICAGHLLNLINRDGRRIHADSLEDPRFHAKTLKVPIPNLPVTDEKLMAAIESLPYDQYRVIYYRYIEGMTKPQITAEYALTKYQIEQLTDLAIQNLKLFFEDMI